MYIGRFVVVGRTVGGEWYLGYRVSSRSYPNRRIATAAGRAMVLPTKDAAPTDNPYISYNCLRYEGALAIVANGSQVDPMMEKATKGYPLRDAMALSLLALDYERDTYNTPRIAGGLSLTEGEGYLAIVGEGRLLVERVTPEPGQALLIATYECTAPTSIELIGESAEALCDALFGCAYEFPVAALALTTGTGGVRLASRSARE